MENRDIGGALQRSRDLTRGHRWAIFGLLLMVMVAVWALFAILLLFVGVFGFNLLVPATTTGGLGFWIYTLVVNGLIGPAISLISLAGSAVIYVELRGSRDGVGVEALADVFR